MPFRKHQRRSIRLKGYNYASEGAYFVTICTFDRMCILGEIKNGEMILNDIWKIVCHCWAEIEKYNNHVKLGQFIIMPNHIHGIIVIDKPVGATHWVAPTTISKNNCGPKSGSIGAIIGQFKSVATKRIRKFSNAKITYVWQRNYYEHIIRNNYDLNQIRMYIKNNPLKWDLDRNNPKNIKV